MSAQSVLFAALADLTRRHDLPELWHIHCRHSLWVIDVASPHDLLAWARALGQATVTVDADDWPDGLVTLEVVVWLGGVEVLLLAPFPSHEREDSLSLTDEDSLSLGELAALIGGESR